MLAPWGVLPWAIYLLTATAWLTVVQRILFVRKQLTRARVVLLYILGLILWGFIVGALARLALPGPDPMPWYATIGLGLGGSLVGGLVAQVLLGMAGGLIFAFSARSSCCTCIAASPRAGASRGLPSIANLLSSRRIAGMR